MLKSLATAGVIVAAMGFSLGASVLPAAAAMPMAHHMTAPMAHHMAPKHHAPKKVCKLVTQHHHKVKVCHWVK